jgi:hypothetical protein
MQSPRVERQFPLEALEQQRSEIARQLCVAQGAQFAVHVTVEPNGQG